MPLLSGKPNNKLKIGYLLDDTLDSTDGVQQYVLAVSEYMRSKGHEVHYLVAETSRRDLKNVHQLARFVSMKFNANSVRTPLPARTTEIKRILNELQLDVLHVQMPYSPLFASKVIRHIDPRVTIVGTWHTFPAGTLQLLSHKVLAFFIKPTLKKFATTIGVSQATADFADGVYRTNSIVIPNAVSLAKFRHSHADSHQTCRIVFLGRFDERKGPKYLIQALSTAVSKGLDMQNVEVVMGGKGPDLEKCKLLARQLNLHEKIQFLGYVEENEKPELLASADICIFPSTGGEAFGISLVEAMASGNAVVIGGDNAGYRSILGGKPELLFNPRDLDAFVDLILRTVNMPKKHKQALAQWLSKEANQYDTTVVCEKLLSVYRRENV